MIPDLSATDDSVVACDPAAAPSPARLATPENIRLVIWDLDDTFWSGTLEEGSMTLLPRNVEMVRILAERGIVSSIASKNHHSRVQQVLEDAGIWDLFVLPQIAFLPKGDLVRLVIETVQLRAASVLFIDDNTINLNEVAHYNPGIQIATPAVLTTLLDDPRCKGAPDPTLNRLQTYKILERREADRTQHSSDNTEFLRQSEIRISIHHDVMEAFDRVHDLINRTNQLNFTKRRLSPDIDEARSQMHAALTRQYNAHAAYIKVADKYGYYGICGFYMMRNYAAEHFVFSCRILNMGIEQLIYRKIGRPHLAPHDDVVSNPADYVVADWITIVDDAQAGAPVTRTARQSATICLRGGCELSQSAHYLRERYEVEEEFPYPNGPWAIETPLADYVALKPVYDLLPDAEMFNRPWFDRKLMQGHLFSRSADIYVLSFGQEPYVFRYRHKATGLIFPLNLGPFNTKDLTQLSYASAVATCDVKMTEAEWAGMQADFVCLSRFDAKTFATNLTALLDLIADKRIVILLTNTEFGRFTVINDLNERVNTVVKQVVHGRPIDLIELDTVIESDAEVLEMNHFRREVYMRLARVIADTLDSPPPEVSVDAPVFKPTLVPRRNFLPAHNTMTGFGWGPRHDATVQPSDLPPRFAGTQVMRHLLTVSTSYSTMVAFGCLLAHAVTPGDTYTISAWVWIPTGFRGRDVAVCCAGRSARNVTRASLDLRETWQVIWATIDAPIDDPNLLACLNILGESGDEIHSTGWKLESGSAASEYVPLADL